MDIIKHCVVFVQVNIERTGHLFAGGVTPQAMFQTYHLPLQAFVLFTHGTAENIIGTQFIENCTAHMLFGKGFKEHTPLRVKPISCIYQANHRGTHQILWIQMRGELGDNSPNQIFDQRQMLDNQARHGLLRLSPLNCRLAFTAHTI